MKTTLRPIKISSMFILTTAVLSFAFTNCSKVDFGSTESSKTTDDTSDVTEDDVTEDDDSGDEVATQPPVEEAIKNCADAVASGKILSSKQTVEFKDTRVESGREQVCEFGVGDNLTVLDKYVRARYEQSRKLDLPAGAVICDVSMSTAVQKFKYDDVFYLTFNNRILASNLASSVVLNDVEAMPLTSGVIVPLYNYDWLKVRGAYFVNVNSEADDYCLGSAQGQSTCQWPLSEKSGNIQFSYNSEMLINIGLKASSSDQKFGFVISGDNDLSSDCYHENLNFEMNVSYYVQ